MNHSLSQGSTSSPTISKAIAIPKPAQAGRPSPISSYELVSPLGSDPEVFVASSPEVNHTWPTDSPADIPTYPPGYAFLGYFSDYTAIFPDNHTGSSYTCEGMYTATPWVPTVSNDELSGVFGMPGGQQIPQTPFWSPLNSLGGQVALDAAASLGDTSALPSTSESVSPPANGSDVHSIYVTTINMDTDQSMDDLNQWIHAVSQGFS